MTSGPLFKDLAHLASKSGRYSAQKFKLRARQQSKDRPPKIYRASLFWSVTTMDFGWGSCRFHSRERLNNRVLMHRPGWH